MFMTSYMQNIITAWLILYKDFSFY